MHFICSAIGSSGDVHPMVGLALALKEKGHEITFVVNGYFRQLVESFGLEYVELGTADDFLAATKSPDLWKPLRAFRHIWNTGLAPSLLPQFEAFSQRYRPGETVGIGSTLCFGARMAQEAIGMPLVTVHVQPAVIWSGIEPPVMPGSFGPRWMQRAEYFIGERFFIDRAVRPKLNAFRTELRLQPIRSITRWWHSPWCVLCLFPAWYARPQDDWPPNLIQTDFPLWDERTDERLPDDVESFSNRGDAPIVFTPGSANIHGQGFVEAVADACRRLQRRGILLTRFPEQIPPRLPNGVVYFDYVPFSLLLPRAAAVVHHGGIGSTAQGLAAGVPHLIMTLAHDQFDNAARIKRFGVGDALKPSRFRGPEVACKLKTLLSSHTVKLACQSYAEKMTRQTGLAAAASAIVKRANQSPT